MNRTPIVLSNFGGFSSKRVSFFYIVRERHHAYRTLCVEIGSSLCSFLYKYWNICN
jgi:hypothetical protein